MLNVFVSATSFSKDERLRESASSRFPNLKFNFCDPSTQWNEDALRSAISTADYWIVGKEPVSAAVLASAVNLKGICKYGVGLDNVDFSACEGRGIPFYFEAGVNSQEVAEQALSLMIALSRNLLSSSQEMGEGKWIKDGGRNFSGKTVAVIGCGHVGSKVARLSRAFSCSVLVTDILDKSSFCEEIGASQVSCEEALMQADFISFHVPLTDETRSLISGDAFQLLKPGVILVNTSRGEVINLNDLKDNVDKGLVAGAALDVFEKEPFTDKSLFRHRNIYGTSHIAGNSQEAVWKMGQAALNGLDKFLLDR